MLYYLHQFADTWWTPLRIFQYGTFRALGGAATAFLITLQEGTDTKARIHRHVNKAGDRPFVAFLIEIVLRYFGGRCLEKGFRLRVGRNRGI